LDQIDLAAAVDPPTRRLLATHAPEHLTVPGGRTVRLRYRDNNAVAASVKLQLVIGMKDSPRIGPRRVPVTFELLAPNGRPVQVTNDLQSFWTRVYPEIRTALRARYPKHKWP
jgi:ATP-dependent RNA helicase HrpB